MAASKGIFVISLVIFFLFSVSCLPEPGKKALYFNTNHTYRSFSKTMNKGYSIAIKGLCKGYSGKIQINWRLEISECAERFSFLKDNDEKDLEALWNIFANYSLNGKQEVDCNSAIHLRDLTNEVKELIIPPTLAEESQSDDSSNTDKKSHDSDSTESIATSEPIKTTVAATATEAKTTLKTKNRGSTSTQVALTARSEPTATTNGVNDVQNRKRRSEEVVKPKSADGDKKRKKTDKVKVAEKQENKKEDVTEPSAKTPKEEKVDSQVCVTRHDGVYLLIVNALAKDEKHSKKLQLTLNVEMKSKHGYLSASDWPLYPFYGCMSLLYVFYGIVWLIVSAFQWRDLLRIQFWIGGVICLGMLEKAVFFSEYNNINITGETNPSLTIFAELVSCVKRTLARILVIIVSMGFGIVKPRLGATLHRVLGVGALYFILAAVEGCFRSLHPKSDPGRQQLIASVPLAVLDASICWWIFMSLVQTTRTLRIRRNLIKLSLYRHFTNTLIFAVLASVAYMIWSIKTHRFAKDGCITDWSELWLDEAFWHFLFSIVLLVIMVLWRPTANNQRYAFTPIVDFGDDEDDDNMTLSEAFDGMKMRNVKNVPEVHINGDSKRKHKPEDDLKWVEENIPSSVADTVLPSVLDSDEELMTTKFEISKME